MKRQKLLLCFILTIIIASIPIVALATGKHALLIGIQDYSYHPLFSSLNGPANDLNIVEKVLRDRFGFEDGDFLILMDAGATHSKIEQAFKTLIDTVKPDDFVYIHYSGHGSQTQDRNGDERSGMDQTWVSYGARRDDSDHIDNYEVLDDQINAWLAALYKKTKHIVFVSDSCHSATVSRNMSLVNRAAPIDTRLHLRGGKVYVQLEKNFAVRIGAARDRESAIEFPGEDDTYYGLFTWYWVKALQQAQKEDAWNDVFKRAYAQVTAERGYVQHPQIWGERGLQISGGRRELSKFKIAVTEVRDRTVTIGAGLLSGVTKGSVYRLDADKVDSPILTIKDVSTFESIGNAEDAEEKFKKGDLLIEERHAYNFSPIKIALFADYPEQEDKPLLQTLYSAFRPPSGNEISSIPGYALAKDSEHAVLHLYIVRPKKENGEYIPEPDDDVLPKSFPEQPPQLWVLTPEHRLLYKNLHIRFDEQKPAEGIQVLQKVLRKYARIRELKTLTSPRIGQQPVTVGAYPVEPCQEGPDCITVGKGMRFQPTSPSFRLQELQDRQISEGQKFTFLLRNESEQEDYYCYLINITPKGDIWVIFPDPTAAPDTALVMAGETRNLIRELSFETDTPGEETIKFIASRQSFDVSLLEQAGFQQRGGYKGTFTQLEQLLVNVMYGQRGTVHRHRNDEWITEQVSFEVKPLK